MTQQAEIIVLTLVDLLEDWTFPELKKKTGLHQEIISLKKAKEKMTMNFADQKLLRN